MLHSVRFGQCLGNNENLLQFVPVGDGGNEPMSNGLGEGSIEVERRNRTREV